MSAKQCNSYLPEVQRWIFSRTLPYHFFVLWSTSSQTDVCTGCPKNKFVIKLPVLGFAQSLHCTECVPPSREQTADLFSVAIVRNRVQVILLQTFFGTPCTYICLWRRTSQNEEVIRQSTWENPPLYLRQIKITSFCNHVNKFYWPWEWI